MKHRPLLRGWNGYSTAICQEKSARTLPGGHPAGEPERVEFSAAPDTLYGVQVPIHARPVRTCELIQPFLADGATRLLERMCGL